MFRSVDNEHFVIRSEEGSDDDVKAVMCFYILQNIMVSSCSRRDLNNLN